MRVIESALEFTQVWKIRRVFDQDNITSKKDMENVLTRLERYRHEQRQLQDKLRES